ncbi:tripartite tricarboxylate transporter TctB family protein [Halotalea alkalilenta]|uniref:tripartite tricarboxylate transporter TctB family protein n=1 Tax=Halotalea alkalilenta TaxID=376489 RepID=UPI000486CDB5|nr:tripartite tricarboxylate transporter TctB family protein [Halotalea alkalilenta]
MIYQRVFLAVLLLVCAILAVIAFGYHAPFSYEPVGPRAYPLLLLTLIMAGTLYLLFRPGTITLGEGDEHLDRHVLAKITLCVVLFTIFAACYEMLGFIVSSFGFAVLMGRLYGGTWIASLIGGVLMSIGFYWLFDRILDVPLPLGILSSLEF